VRKFAWIFAVALLVGCSTNPLGVQFDSSVPGDQKGLMQGDLGRLSGMTLSGASATDLYYMSLSDTSAQSLSTWMQTRMRYVVGESFDYDTQKQKISSNSYGETLANHLDAVDPTQLGETQTVMMNLGSYLYLDVKGTSNRYLLHTSSQTFAITSPRIAIFQIGIGLFDANSIQGVDLSACANSVLRIATYFHEGRHDDSNGANAGFPHSTCPSGKYNGLYACESNINGPYAIQTIFLRLASQFCQGLNGTETSGLELSVADYASRQIGYQLPDATPETYTGAYTGNAQ
jgi:hypothetical protein